MNKDDLLADMPKAREDVIKSKKATYEVVLNVSSIQQKCCYCADYI